MDEQEIEAMIDRIGAQRRADREYVMQMAAKLNEGLPEWCARQRRIQRTVMMLLLAVPSTLFFALPQSEPVQVACNMAGGEAQVMDCARNLISIA